MKQYRASKVFFLKSVECGYRMVPDNTKMTKVSEGTAIGNFEGHTGGVIVTDHGDTVTLRLSADFIEVWEKVPKSVLRIELPSF